MRRSFEAILDLLFPPACVICNQDLQGRTYLKWGGQGLCEDCGRQVPWIRRPYCPTCARPFLSSSPTAHVCGDCLLRPTPFDSARALVRYEGEIPRLFQRMKYGPQPALARFFGELLAEYLQGDFSSLGLDGVIPIPLHPGRLRQRGFNQAAVLAGRLARRLALQVVYHGLVRCRPTPPQVGMSRQERLINMRRAFRVPSVSSIAGGRWLLVDDVYTTGATLQEAARQLRRSNAAAVHVVTVARVV
jgi:ComF family protein